MVVWSTLVISSFPKFWLTLPAYFHCDSIHQSRLITYVRYCHVCPGKSALIDFEKAIYCWRLHDFDVWSKRRKRNGKNVLSVYMLLQRQALRYLHTRNSFPPEFSYISKAWADHIHFQHHDKRIATIRIAYLQNQLGTDIYGNSKDLLCNILYLYLAGCKPEASQNRSTSKWLFQ